MDTTNNADAIKKFNDNTSLKKQPAVDQNKAEVKPSSDATADTIIPPLQGPSVPKDKTENDVDRYKSNAQKILDDRDKLQQGNSDVIAAKALKTQAAIAAQDAKVKREREQLLEKQHREAKHTAQEVGTATEGLSNSIADTTNPYLKWFGRIQTPGGILTMVLILMFFLFAVTPVNKDGDTRLKLLWLTLTGKTSLDYGNQNPNTSSSDPNSGGGAGGPFGNTVQTPTNGNTLPASIDLSNINILDLFGPGL